MRYKREQETERERKRGIRREDEREREREIGGRKNGGFILIPYRQNLSYVYSFLSDNS
jgi:hypothetical protein